MSVAHSLRRELLSSATIAPQWAEYNKWPAVPAWLLSNLSKFLHCGSIYKKFVRSQCSTLQATKFDDQYSLLFVWVQTLMAFQIRIQLTDLFQLQFHTPESDLVDSFPAHLLDSYAHDFCLADDVFYSGRLEATSRGRQKYCNHWQKYVSSVGVDPYLQDTHFLKHIQLLSGFAARVHTGYYGNGSQVKFAQSVARSRPLARQLHWPVTPILPRS